MRLSITPFMAGNRLLGSEAIRLRHRSSMSACGDLTVSFSPTIEEERAEAQDRRQAGLAGIFDVQSRTVYGNA